MERTLDTILGLHRVKVGDWVKLPNWDEFYEIDRVMPNGDVWVCYSVGTAWYGKSKMDVWIIR